MNRWRIVAPVVIVPLILLIAWIASHTYWDDVKLPTPPKGEALTNPFYAAQRFAEALGAQTTRDYVLASPPTDAVIVLSDWHWTLSSTRRDTLERWVESGGRLVLVGALTGGRDEFERWSRVIRQVRQPTEAEALQPSWRREACASFQEERDGVAVSGAQRSDYTLCDFDTLSSLTSARGAVWALRNAAGIQAIRVAVGRGSVTVINGTPFVYQRLFDGDHGRLFTAATGLRRGDEVHFLPENARRSLLALIWFHGAPVVSLAFILLALALWRGSVRFGPLAAPVPTARRSLAEQIRGSGRFALRHGGGRSLHAACLRAVEEAADRQIKAYARLPTPERIGALERLTGFNRRVLAEAIDESDSRSVHDVRRTLALLEAARRQILIEHKRSLHGIR